MNTNWKCQALTTVLNMLTVLAGTVPVNHHVINLEWIKGNMFHQNRDQKQFPEIYT